MKEYLGEFEELVLLTVASLTTNAYGVSIKNFMEQRLKRDISIGSLHSTITRLEEKGYLTSSLGEPTQERGGRRKRFYQVTKSGKSALQEIKDLRDQLWVTAKPALSSSK
ncbi:PadR family transcriptional regulator [Chryseosolibacter indicus]|uniref:PadR family transcriptional regulator n=1 Tax=Chryseosolibacter indicus TaxID=2782351 RepID=A0ABS5VWH5_9BACT|nr:PadR family transcriptional regulator [Chryseosolibacter indicus]MBT1705777.1 PadR family transcriptional regulator [Chryseosolibacter indicus]